MFLNYLSFFKILMISIFIIIDRIDKKKSMKFYQRVNLFKDLIRL